jgi:antitoxin ParD1/3/4
MGKAAAGSGCEVYVPISCPLRHSTPISVWPELITIIKSGILGEKMEIAMISADLGLQLENFVTRLVEAGRYNSKSEVLREGIRLIQERETRLSVLDQALSRGIADADAGRAKPLADVAARLEAKYQAMGRARG